MIREISLENGKYILRYNEENSEIDCLRYKEQWRKFDIGDKLILVIFQEIESLKQYVKDCKRELHEYRMMTDDS